MNIKCEEEINLNINNTVYLNKLSNRQFFPPAVQVVVTICYVSLYTVNLVGNVSIWMAIRSRKTLQTPMNYLLLNLSLAHIISGSNIIFFAFVTDTGSLANSQTSLNALCSYTEGLCVYFISAGVYLFTLCAISVNRYVVIKYPTRHELRMKKKGIIIYSFLAWLLCIGFIIPSIISFRYDRHIKLCERNWRYISHPLVYRISILLISIFLPLTCLIISFGAILWKRFHNADLLNNCAVRNKNLQRAEKLLGISLFTFLLTWFPFFLYWFLRTFNYFHGCDGSVSAMKWSRITLLFSTINGAIDPIIYTVGNHNLKMAISYQMGKLFPIIRQRRENNNVQENVNGQCGKTESVSMT
ncbi:kappa-type opioid receptor-like [Hydractinia symbiolongicarpus]|uniref:kappa-type opioid receptor-like n=1 Tax=Hydractinia symbiolongicarpus TaxID=13093 RepID=UPI00254C2F05|nr:kappa-type opioid receptor-like [Hydractinia symbiolongicarpus]